MALEQQMEMNFGDVPDNTIGVDPVSGNEIPLGSNAENVRDDIPANLSEGEIVIPADVVNFHGVKLFEDLRAEAKMGYAQMAQDGRMGGEPMMDEDMDIEITIEDLDVMDDEEPVAMSKGGMNAVEPGKLRNTRRSVNSGAQAAARSMSKAGIRNMSGSGGRKKPMTAAQHQAKIRGGSLAGRDRNKPVNVAAVNPNAGPTIAQQINWAGKGGFDFRDKRNPIQKLFGIGESATEAEVRKLAEQAQIRRDREAKVEEIRQRRLEKEEEQANLGNAASGSTGSDPLGGPGAGAVQYGGGGGGGQPNTTSVWDGTQGKSFGEVIGAINPFNYFDEGGLVNPEPFYSQKGGFDLSSVNTAVVEYMNDEGHRIFITFVDGVPQMEIPEGYYPAGDAVSIDDVVNYTIPTMDGISSEPVQSVQSSSSKRDKPSTPAPTPINYKELSVEEITQMIEDQKSLGSKFIKTINPLIRLAMWDQTRRLKAEIERRRDDPYTSEVDKRRYDQLLEIANADEPGLLATLLDKVTGKEPEEPGGRTQEQTDALYNQLDKMTKAYTPDPQEANNMQLLGFEGMGPAPDEGQPITTPGVDAEIPGVPLTRAQIEAAKQISQEAAANAFTQPEEEPEPQPAPQTQVQQMRTTQQDNKEKKKQTARDRSKAFSLASKKTGDSIAKIGRTVAPSNERTNIDYGDPRRGGAPSTRTTGGGGRNKGGLASKKGKKKKSK